MNNNKKHGLIKLTLLTNIIFYMLSTENVDNLVIGGAMCGRFVLYSDPRQIAKLFDLNQNFNFEFSYNIAPSSMIPVVIELPDHERMIELMRWGLVPSWQKEEDISTSMINARAETINSKPAFRKAILQRRCLIVADGFYEWQHENGKQPFFIRMKHHEPFGMAGVWERWVGENKTIDSCSIITVEANKLISTIHNRMPCIIKPEDYKRWLDTNSTSWDEIKDLLNPYEDKYLEAYSVSKQVNNVRHNQPDCITKQ